MNVKLLLAYDGSDFLGWQDNNKGPSIESALRAVLEQILQEKILLQAASRTDAGVHAKGQVINFITSKPSDLQRLKRSANQLLPPSIAILHAEQASDDFHPTLEATGKEYHYSICLDPVQLPSKRNFSWHIPYPLLLSPMQETASLLVGTHDFSAFCNERSSFTKDAVRTLYGISLNHNDHGLEISISGNAFLYRMVRNLVGTLVYVGRGKIPPADIPRILDCKERRLAGITAPAHGLCLNQVFYDPLTQ